jgi:hypothetical protein
MNVGCGLNRAVDLFFPLAAFADYRFAYQDVCIVSSTNSRRSWVHESIHVHIVAQKNIGHRSSQSQRERDRVIGAWRSGPFAQLAS